MLDKGFFSFKPKTLNFKNFKNNLKLTLSGISGAFILPIGTLAVCSIFLALGSLIESFTGKDNTFNEIGKGIKALSFPVIKAIPFLFCVAFAISFTKNNPDAIWCAIICYLIFLGVQNAFIREDLANGQAEQCKNCSRVVKGYTVLFSGAGRDKEKMLNIVDRTLGVTSLNTSIFGSLLLGGLVVPYLIKNFSDIKLPKHISFFSGKRFIPFVAAIFSAILALLFLVVWPWAGIGISWLGQKISKTPYGVDSFIFGVLEKSLIPFGLHHFFYSPFWYSSLGGDVVSEINEKVCCGCSENLCLKTNGSGTCCNGNGQCCTGDQNCCKNEKCCFKHISDINHSATAALFNLFSGAYAPHTMWQGDSFIGLSAISAPSNDVTFKNGNSSNGSQSPMKILEFLDKQLNIKVGRFTQGKYPIMQFALPATGLAMIYAAPKETRKEAKKVIFPGILSSLILGITEPIEFTFLFLAPVLFYGFHAIACGASFMLMNLLGARIPSVFSGGILELIILGAIPIQKGTKFYYYFLVGIVLAPIYFLVFYNSIKYFNIKTPGRESIKTEDLSSKSTITSKVPEKTRKLAIAFGGWDNISKFSNCASRLRYDIVDKSQVSEEELKKAGVIAVKWVGDNHVQAIVGPQAESINNEMLKWKGEDLGMTKDKDSISSTSITSSIPKQKMSFQRKIELSEEEKELLWNVFDNLGHKSNIVQYFVSGESLYIEFKNIELLNIEKISALLSSPMYRIVNKNTCELFLGENINLFYAKFEKYFNEYNENQ